MDDHKVSIRTKAVEEARERHEHASHAAPSRRWIPLVAALLAVVAALANLASNQRSSDALIAKNEAILAQAKASDAYNFYEARGIKEHAYEALVDAGLVRDPQRLAKLSGIAKRERVEKAKPLADAQRYERAVAEENERSERVLHAHEILEIAVTLFEVAIVLVSISALVTTRLLNGSVVVAAAFGAIAFVIGLASR